MADNLVLLTDKQAEWYQQRGIIPNGCVILPKDPTEAMIRAAAHARLEDFNKHGTTLSPMDCRRAFASMYAAMIQAAQRERAKLKEAK